MDKWVTVRDMYHYCINNDIKLLSEFNSGLTGDFWAEYRTNSDLYDKLFDRLYKNFRYFDQEVGNDEDISDITSRFIVDVLAHLTVNRKKYEELQRVDNLTNDEYNILGNINYRREEHGDATTNLGQRTDTSSTISGQRQDTVEDENSPFEGDDYVKGSKTTTNKGQQTDTDATTKGAEIDTNLDNRTVTIKGKESAQSNASIIEEHNDSWKRYEYYNYIFASIAKDLLLI